MEYQNSIVSVITPIFNGEKYIEETLLSILECRKYSEIQIIVVNDGSSDGTKAILEKYKSEIVILEQSNSGQASAINRGLSEAIGKYSSIVNSDDPITNAQIFKKSIHTFQEHENLVATYPDWTMINSDGQKIRNVLVAEYSESELIGKFNCIIGPGGVFRTANALQVGGWDKSYKYVPDYDFWLKLSRTGNFKRIPEFLCSWRTHLESISVKHRGREMADERVRVMENFTSNYKLSNKIKRSGLSHSYHSAAMLCYFDHRVKGRKLLCKAISIYPSILLKTKLKINLFIIFYPLSKKLTSLFKIQPKV
jgi:glycosyltransferase involved in cell wall biosynthesis